ncbi:MAG: putative toxin-antitoxin system toxin component, PIN family [Deltaproteobacteria bacterium]|nr:putative toxin-antitoxin system toxin component, PIN family [Deltaproteobacteria bacterium]
MKAVLDTNVLISGVLWKGTPFEILKWAEEYRLLIYSSLAILSEVHRVLNYPKLQKYVETEEVLCVDLFTKIASLCTVVDIDKVVEGAGHDPDDDKFLSCALSANVDILVSGDNHLLDLKKYHSIRIVTPREFFDENKGKMT